MVPEEECTFRDHGASVNAVSYSPNMKQLVSAADSKLMLWSFRSQLRVSVFESSYWGSARQVGLENSLE